jgi:hypothetical protein
MFSSNSHEQTIIEISQGDYIATTAESFLVVGSVRHSATPRCSGI